MMRWLSPFMALVLVLLWHAPSHAETAAPAPAEQSALAAGAIAALKGTPHLWIADETGTLHWSGDTRALAGHAVDWGNRREVTVDELKGL
jgi:hypothetical protein